MDQPDPQKEFDIIRRQLRAAGLVALAALTTGAVFYHYVEKLNWLDAFYFCTITLATVGYGDIVPHTDAGKLFTIFYVIAGIGILATFANLLIKQAVAKRELKRVQHHKEKKR